MARIKADRVMYVAVGLPDNNLKPWSSLALVALEMQGFRAMEMTPDDITAQADHIRQTQDNAKEQTA